MKTIQAIPNKIYLLNDLIRQIAAWQILGKKIVFTNGVFDIIHKGHIASLSEAASYGDRLVVGINDDASVKRLKGETRPVNEAEARALVLASLVQVDAVCIFTDDTPLQMIMAIKPDVLVKGGDYTLAQIVGASEVMAAGGLVKMATIIPDISTTAIIEKLKK